MKFLARLLVPLALAVAVVGCGKDDPNKNLKPIDPSVKPPKPATESGGGGGGTAAEKPAGVIK
jgi:hypothetical protein